MYENLKLISYVYLYICTKNIIIKICIKNISS